MDRSIFERIEERPCRRGGWIRFRAQTPTLRPEGGGFCFGVFRTVIVPAGTGFEEAAARSLAFTLEPEGRLSVPYSHMSFRRRDTREHAWSWYKRLYRDKSVFFASVSAERFKDAGVPWRPLGEMALVAKCCRLVPAVKRSNPAAGNSAP